MNLKEQLAIQAIYESQASAPKVKQEKPKAMLSGEVPVEAPKRRGRPRKAD